MALAINKTLENFQQVSKLALLFSLSALTKTPYAVQNLPKTL